MNHTTQVLFTSRTSVARAIEELLQQTTLSIDVAMYRLTNPRLAQGLEGAHGRGVQVRLITDEGKFEATETTRSLLSESAIRFRTIDGRKGKDTKLHHKFAILDRKIVLAGSYNWTLESEEGNYDYMLVLSEPALVAAYQEEFDALWPQAHAAG